MNLQIEQLIRDDLIAAENLSTTVGWNQTYEDWSRLLELFPDTCFAGYSEGTLVATSTLAIYEDRVGWIGMVLVHPEYRTQGYGSAIFEHALEAGQESDLDVIGLDATDAGRHIYNQYDFERIVGINRWRGTLDWQGDKLEKSTGPISDVDAVATFDANRTGVDRRRLLEHLLDSDTVTGFRVPANGVLRGFAVLRPGRTCPQLGPIVAVDRDALHSLLASAAEAVDGEVVIDTLDRDAYRAPLEMAGLSISRSLHRMTYEGTKPALHQEDVIAATGFEWG